MWEIIGGIAVISILYWIYEVFFKATGLLMKPKHIYSSNSGYVKLYCCPDCGSVGDGAKLHSVDPCKICGSYRNKCIGTGTLKLNKDTMQYYWHTRTENAIEEFIARVKREDESQRRQIERMAAQRMKDHARMREDEWT